MDKHVDVPYLELDPETLRGLIEEFVTRDGTDYGEREATLESKVAQVKHQLALGEAKIVFDPRTKSVSIHKILQ
jgi:uncharacterized protein